MSEDGVGSWRILAVLGGFLGVFCVFIYFVAGAMGAWWTASFDALRVERSTNINAFGYLGDNAVLNSTAFFAGVLFVCGSFLALTLFVKEHKAIGLTSAAIMFLGLVLFLSALYATTGIQGISNNTSKVTMDTILYGHDGNYSWGLGLGFFIGLVSTFLVLIGSLKLK